MVPWTRALRPVRAPPVAADATFFFDEKWGRARRGSTVVLVEVAGVWQVGVAG